MLTGAYQGLLGEALPDLDPAYRAPFADVAGSPQAVSLNALDTQVLSAPPGTIGVSAAQYGRVAQSVALGLAVAGFSAGQKLATALNAAAGPINLRLIVTGGVGLAAVLASIALSVWIGRGIISELAALRREALELARRRLPRVMARLSSGEKVDVEAEAPALPADCRRNLAMRSQSLLHQQLLLLDSLEQRASGPEELDRLFQIDHLATRMRRNAEGLLVLAGEQPGRRRITIDDEIVLYLFGMPGQERFWFMWNELGYGATGVVILADTRRLADCFTAVDYFELRQIPFIVAVNAFDGAPRFHPESVRAALDLDPHVPLVMCDARDRTSCRDVLLALIAHLRRLQEGAYNEHAMG
jgi:hypothetical protein